MASAARLSLHEHFRSPNGCLGVPSTVSYYIGDEVQGAAPTPECIAVYLLFAPRAGGVPPPDPLRMLNLPC